MIKNYFYNDEFYKSLIKKKKDPRIIKEYKKILKYKKKIKFVYQNKPLGTGDAVLKTKKFIKNNYFLMLLPDDLIMKKNCSKDMIKIHKKLKGSVMASMKVKKNNVVTFPGKISDAEREVEAIIFAAAEPLSIETIESKISKKTRIGISMFSKKCHFVINHHLLYSMDMALP